MSTQTITEFLEARIDEDEARAGSGWSRLGDTRWETDNYGRNFLTPSAALAECAAKRAIVNLADESLRAQADRRDASALGAELMHDDVLCVLAAVYKDHPDYRQEWAK